MYDSSAKLSSQLTDKQLFKLGEGFYLIHDDQEALRYFFKVLEFMGEDESLLFETYKYIGNIYVREHDWDGAEEYYNKAYTLNPFSDVLMVNYGILEMQRDQWDLALKKLRYAVQINSKNDKAWVALALIHRFYGDQELSLSNIEKALDINPENTTATALIYEWR